MYIFIYIRLIYNYDESEDHGKFGSLPQFPVITRVLYNDINNICISISSQSFIVKLKNSKSFVILTRQKSMTNELIQFFTNSCSSMNESFITQNYEMDLSLIQVYYIIY